MTACKTHRYRIFRAGNRCGKSEIGVVDMLMACQGWHPYFPKTPPIKAWCVCLDWESVGQVLWPKFKRYLSMNEVSVGWQRRVGVEIPESIHFKNGSSIIFKSAESGRERFQGSDLDLAWIDEEIDSGLVEEIKARLIDRGGLLNVTLTPVTRKAWVGQLEREVSGGVSMTKVVRASMRDAADAGILDKVAVGAYLDSLPEIQRKVREYGDFSRTEGLVYPEFSEHTHVVKPKDGQLWTGDGKNVAPWPLPRDWPRYGGIDFGYAVPTAVPLIVEDPSTGRLYVERCYYSHNVRISKWAEILRAELPPLVFPLVADHQAFERAELGGCGIQTIPAKKDIWPGLEAVERALYPLPDGRPKLQFVVFDHDPPKHPVVGRYDAHWLVWEIGNYRYKEKDPKDKHVNAGRDLPVKKEDHACDALRYLLTHLEKRAGGEAPYVAAADNKLSPLAELLGPNSPFDFKRKP